LGPRFKKKRKKRPAKCSFKQSGEQIDWETRKKEGRGAPKPNLITQGKKGNPFITQGKRANEKDALNHSNVFHERKGPIFEKGGAANSDSRKMREQK